MQKPQPDPPPPSGDIPCTPEKGRGPPGAPHKLRLIINHFSQCNMWSELANKSKPQLRIGWIILIKAVQEQQHLWQREPLICYEPVQVFSGPAAIIVVIFQLLEVAVEMVVCHFYVPPLFVGFQTFGLFSDGIPGISQHESAQIKRFIFTISTSC